jgi:glycosyltransferase involved in cell wall biosynthesis
MPKISVVVPVYQDELSIRANFFTLKTALDSASPLFDYEIILINDGSTDNSLLILEQLHAEYPQIVGVVNLVRNFGQVAAVIAGLARVSGDCAVIISSDLQDPPELIVEMFNRWRHGAETVLAIRESRDDPWYNKLASRMFYRLMRRYALASLPSGGFDFFLLDRAVITRVLGSAERNGFLQGQILAASSKIVQIPYKRRARRSGTSGWGPLRKLKYLVDGFVAYSFLPIRLISFLGIATFILALLLSCALVLQNLLFGTAAPGWSSLMIALLVLHGFELLAIGVLGEYVWRALDQIRPRPLYVVDYYKAPLAESAP